MTEDDSTDEYRSWDFFDDLPPEAFIHHYESIENVPAEYQEEARQRVLNMNDNDVIDFITTGERIPFKFDPDFINAIAIATLEGLADSITDDGEAILEMCEDTDVSPVSIPPEQLGYKLFQIHTVATSYAESAAQIILWHHTRDASEWNIEYLIEWASHEDRVGDEIGNIDDLDQKVNKIREWAAGSVKRLSLVLKQGDIIDDPLYEDLDNVRDRRNNFIHSAAMLAINDFGDSDDVRNSVEECLSVASGLSEELDDISRHPIYDFYTVES